MYYAGRDRQIHKSDHVFDACVCLCACMRVYA